MPVSLNALSATTDINTIVELVNKSGAGTIKPEVFYSKQLLDTIRMDSAEFVYYRLADTQPIQGKADTLVLRRWSALQAHTTPLIEGIPPMSDKGSAKQYSLSAKQYGRYMEFTDKVSFEAVDAVIAHFSKEYSIVAMETLDLLARETLMGVAQRKYAGTAVNFEALTVASKPTLADLRLVILEMKQNWIKPRTNGKYQVIGSPEFFFDMVSDPIVEKYMTINQKTETMYSHTKLVPLFDMEFYETQNVPTSGIYYDGDGKKCLRYYTVAGETYTYGSLSEDNASEYSSVNGYVKDPLNNQDSSYIPGQDVWTLPAGGVEMKAQHVFIIGKDALVRTGLSGEDNAKMYVKPLGSAGVLDPIDQRQSIGFKINSVGFGSVRPEAIVDYICVPSQLNS